MNNTAWVLIDTETTGLTAQIFVVELAAQRMRGWEPIGEPYRRLLNQNADIPPEASRVHGYTKEILERDGDPAATVYRDFSLYVGSRPIVSYNLDYDLEEVLKPEWLRLGIEPIGTSGFCALRLAQRMLDPVPAGNCKLQTLRQFYRLPERGAHTALGDVQTVSDLMANVLRPIAERRGLKSWSDIRAYTRAEWFPSRIAFGKFKGRDFRDARTDKPERCFLPIHVYDTERSRPVAVVLRPGKTPSGVEVRAHLRRLVRRIRSHWPKTRILFRGDGHYARPEAMTWCEDNGVDYVFGLPGTKPLSKKVDETADAVRTERALDDKDVVRGFAETRHRAGSWHKERRAVARIEATRLGLDIRFIVTNLDHGSAEWLYESLYCARGQAENLIKLHKSQLASDRTSCRSALANQVRLVLHTAAYWLMLAVRDAIPAARDLAKAEFATLRLKLLKIAARVVEMASRVRLAFAAACPEADLFVSLPAALMPRGP
jgi:DNA polymerase III epsilon subunit-like protein